MAAEALAGPLARLLEMGKPIDNQGSSWPDYLSLGIGPEHIPDLITVATDRDLLSLPDENDPLGWGPVHAWRALGQLHAEQAAVPLMQLFHEVRDNDWVIEEMPDVFGMIGPCSLAGLITYLRCETYPPYARLIAATSLAQIAKGYSETRDTVISALVEQLMNFKKNSAGVNGVLIANLVELGASEQSELIQRVFVESKVDRFIAGDWRDIKKKLRQQGPSDQQPANITDTGPRKASPNRPAYQEPRTTPRV